MSIPYSTTVATTEKNQ